MDRDVFTTSVIELIDRRPFKPFTIALSDGMQYEIDHGRAITCRDGVAVYIRPGGAPVIFDHDAVTKIIRDLKDASLSS
jgi:hypothetical protein